MIEITATLAKKEEIRSFENRDKIFFMRKLDKNRYRKTMLVKYKTNTGPIEDQQNTNSTHFSTRLSI